MPKADDLIIVHCINKQRVGYVFERKRNSWPLHITLVPWFSHDAIEELKKSLEKFSDNFVGFDVTVAEQEMFGFGNDIPVNAVAKSANIEQLHQMLLTIATNSGGVLQNDNWTGKSYRAHITRHDSAEVNCNTGDVIRVADFQLVRLLKNDRCKIIVDFGLRSHE